MKNFLMSGLVVTLFLVCGTAHADLIIDFTPDKTFSSEPLGIKPSGSLTATFTDFGTNQVQLFIQNNLSGSEKIGALYFNIETFTSGLTFDLIKTDSSNPNIFKATPTISENHSKADGTGGYFDIVLGFETSAEKAFGGTQSQTYIITATGRTLRASDFDFFSVKGQYDYLAAAHVQSIATEDDGDGSAWVGVTSPTTTPTPTPIPAAAWLLGSGLMGLIGLKRKKIALA